MQLIKVMKCPPNFTLQHSCPVYTNGYDSSIQIVSPWITMVWLVLRENDVIPMVVLVQNKFAISIIARYNDYSLTV